MLSALCWLPGCGESGSSPAEQPVGSITLGTTTSARDSGLLDVLVPMFQRQTGIEVRVVAVGSGQAIELGRRGDADVLLTHAPHLEEQFMQDRHGSLRRPLMRNDFVIVGPQDDPAGIQGMTSAAEAFRTIAEKQAVFVSRGDESGTHQKEKLIWREAGIEPGGDWYLEAGSGMAATLRVANQKRAYTLTDRGTYLFLRHQLDSVVLCEGDPLLQNHYSVMLVNPAKHPHVKHQQAERFVEFLLSPQTQQIIGAYGVKKFGRPLFIPEQPHGTDDSTK